MASRKNLKYNIVFVLAFLLSQGVAAYAAEPVAPAPKAVSQKSEKKKKPAEVTSQPIDALLEEMKPSDKPASSVTKTVDLRRAMAEAYRVNPDLQAARAELRAVDEEYSQAVSGYRPSVAGQASYISGRTDAGIINRSTDPKAVGVEVTQPLYRGGTTAAAVAQSEHLIKSQRALLKVKEQEILQETVAAYMNVLRDYNLVQLNANNEKVLKKYLNAARQRFKLGDNTKTDVSQSESRLAAAVANRITAEGNYKKSRAAFEQVTGLSADNLIKPDLEVAVPATLDEALAEADKNSPDIAYTQYISAAAEATTRAVKGELLPQVDLAAGIDRTYDTAGGMSREDGTSIGLRATIPIFSAGGATYSRIRQSKQVEQQRRMEIRDTERLVHQSVVEAWENLAAANAELTARLSQIDAARTAQEGVQLETDYGSRTTLDLLDSEQEYLDAQSAHIVAERNQIVAAYTLLATVGQLTAESLKLDTPVYDPVKNFQNVKNKWVGGKISAPE